MIGEVENVEGLQFWLWCEALLRFSPWVLPVNPVAARLIHGDGNTTSLDLKIILARKFMNPGSQSIYTYLGARTL
jgi:hypothetical protein